MSKHSSLDKAPDKPFPTLYACLLLSAVSPGKRINVPGQCVNQLLKSNQLLQKGRVKNNIMPSSNLPFETMWGNLNGQTVIFWPHLCNT